MDADNAEIRELAALFKANPMGPHAPALQRLLSVMRGLPIAGKHFLIFDANRNDYVLAELHGQRGAPVIRHEQVRFLAVADGEWHVFRYRLKSIFAIEIEP